MTGTSSGANLLGMYLFFMTELGLNLFSVTDLAFYFIFQGAYAHHYLGGIFLCYWKLYIIVLG